MRATERQVLSSLPNHDGRAVYDGTNVAPALEID
jgi:hypothetical protein